MKSLTLLRSLSALAASAALLAGCGGGDSTPAPPATEIQPTTSLGPSAQYENICTVDAQKKFVRSYLDEVYFWYNEIVDVDPNQFSRPEDYFNALLVRTPDSAGLPKDRFSAVLPASQVSNVLDKSAAASPTTLSAANAVTVTRVVTSPGGRQVGYIQFNNHDFGAQDQLISAFRQIQSSGVQDLVLDLRFNSGGFLYVAQSAASMITGPANNGKIFEQLHYNNKRDALTAASTLTFVDRVQFTETTFPAGTPLPQLSLPRVFVLTSGRTCSASESIINSLRGVDVQVVRVGTTTCGKPYGFTQKNNCGLAYFPIEFQGTNAKGFGDYTTGFRANCEIRDNTAVAAGSANDPLLNGALFFADNNACPANTATGVQSAGTPIVSNADEQPDRPSWRGRMLLPQQQQR